MEEQQEPLVFEWEALEYEQRHKTADWYWGLGSIAVVSAALSVYFGNILFAGVIVLGAFLLGMYAARAPRMEHFVIEDRGVGIGPIFYPFSSLESFWVFDHPEMHPKLFMKSKKLFVPLLILPLAGVNPGDLREFLLDKLHEEEHHESLAEHIMRYFGV